MRVFSESSSSILDEFSKEFEYGYLKTLSHLHGTKRVPANRVYQEYIADKHHIHMNATIWSSLTGFCKYLGKEGKAIVDETEKGWFIQYIDRDPKVIARQNSISERKLVELDEEEKQRRLIAHQIELAQSNLQHDTRRGYNDTGSNETHESVGLVFCSTEKGKKRKLELGFGDDEDESENQIASFKQSKLKYAAAFADVEQTIKSEVEDSMWIKEGIIVKIISGSNKSYLHRKVPVSSISLDPIGAYIWIDNNRVFLREDELQTVVPKVKIIIYNFYNMKIFALFD